MPTIRTTAATSVVQPALRIGQVDVQHATARSTGVSELDRVLGGGLVPGAVVLVAGEPGIGKSTLLLDVAARAARGGQTVLYVSGEESAAQVRMRAERIEAMAASLFLVAETDLATVLGQVEAVQPDLVVVDSVQTIASAQVEGSAGNVSQVREVAASLIQAAKSRGIAVLLVGHVTKDGSIAGPRILEHLVDVVVQFEGDRHSRLRAGPGGEEPLRPDRRGGLLRPVRRRHRRAGRPERAVPLQPRRERRRHLRHRDPRGPPPAGRRGPGAHRTEQHPVPAPGHATAWTPVESRWSWPSSNAGPESPSAAATPTSRPSAECGSASRPPTSPSRSASRAPSSTPPCRPRRSRSARSGSPVSCGPCRVCRAGSPRPRGWGSGSRSPRAGCLGSGPIPEGLRVIEVADVAGAVVAALDVPARRGPRG